MTQPDSTAPGDQTESAGGADATEGAAADVAVAAPRDPAAGRLPTILESLLFAADHPLTTRDLAALVDEPDLARVEEALRALTVAWADRGVQLSPVAGGWQLRTHPASAVWVQRLVAQKPVRLSRSQLETLAIVAYRQPITRPEIDDIRGVDTGGTLKGLLERALVRILGKKEEPGRPLLYGTTREFLEFFNLRDLRELPTLREFQELSDEHRAQVEALERAAPPGTVEGAPLPPPPLSRIDLSDAPIDEDLGAIDDLIGEADGLARAAAAALGSAAPEAPARPDDAAASREGEAGD
jgi:segregation and condensation protein B